MTGYEDRDYQAFGTRFLHTMKRAFLTDDPGLGKTIQAIRAVEPPCLIVCPMYLTGQWEDAILEEDPSAKIARAFGTRKERDTILSKNADWYIVNYDMLSTYDLPVGMKTYVNDESHRLRNQVALQSKVANIIENKDPNSRIYHLTATPMWKSPADIWMQAKILYPNVFPPYRKFISLYCVTLRGPWGPKVVGIKRAMRGPLKELLQPIMLGRTYKDVGRFLPEVIETTVRIDMDKVHRAIYEQLVQNYSIEWGEDSKKLIFESTTVLHALRQVTAHGGKFEAIQGLIEDNNDKPTVIGFWYKDHAQEMYHLLGSEKAVLVTGDLEPVERQRSVLKAQKEGKHIVASQKSLQEGVNLSKYRIFIFGEEDYVPESNRQFMTRVVRDRNDGGKDQEPVRVYYVQVRGSLDVTIHNVAKRRGTAIGNAREILDRTLTH